MKRLKDFIKWHPWFSLLAFPVVLFFSMLFFSLPFILIGYYVPRLVGEIYGMLLVLLFLLLALVYPFILTVCNVYFIIKVQLDRFLKGVSAVTEASTILFGFCLSWLYMTEGVEIQFVNWTETLYNAQVHSPIATWTVPTVAALSLTGIAGYLILRVFPLRRMSPLAIVMAMAAMYLGCIMCALWIVQTCRPDRGGVYLYLFPLNCILIAAKVVRNLIWQWREQTRQTLSQGDARACSKAREGRIGVKGRFKAILYESGNWPWLAFLLMIPLLGILLAVLTLFGQEPDCLIDAWTHTSQWNLSQKTSPSNIQLDMHYLCTAAAAGHPRVVKPLRMGLRHGHVVVVNRQLCIANAFEQIIMERLPGLHRRIRHVYDAYGYPIARHIRTPLAADAVYILMKPLEWFFLATIYLSDVRPEDRIAMQYIPALKRS